MTALLSICLATPTHAADLPSIKSAPQTAPAPIWTGLYAGLNAGGVLGNNNSLNNTTWNVYQPASNADYALAALLSGNGAGGFQNAALIGGGQIGYSNQLTFNGFSFVTGGEADIQGLTSYGGSGNRWNSVNTDNFGAPVSLQSNQKGFANISYLGTVRTRFGMLVTPNLLVFGSGGLAYGGLNLNIQNTQFWTTTGGAQAGSNSVMIGSNSAYTTQVGWSVGGGLEWMFAPNWSAKAEYLYYDLGQFSSTVVNNYYGTGGFAGNNGIQNASSYTGHITGNIIRAGMNYHFNIAPVPVVAKY